MGMSLDFKTSLDFGFQPVLCVNPNTRELLKCYLEELRPLLTKNRDLESKAFLMLNGIARLPLVYFYSTVILNT